MEATSLAAALGALVDYEVNKERKGVIPPSFSVLPCAWQSRAPLNSGGKSGAEWSQRSGAHSCRELPAALYLPWRKERPAAASEAFSLPFNRDPVKGAQTGLCWIQRGKRVRNGSQGGKGGRGSNWGKRVCKGLSLRPLEEVGLDSINHNGN